MLPRPCFPLLLCLPFFVLPPLSAEPPKAAKPLIASASRPGATYQQGETVTFNLEAPAGSAVPPGAEVTWTISKDGVPPIESGKILLSGGRASVTAKLDEPGFLLCRATALVNGTPVAALAGAAVNPLAIRPSMPVPEDFDAFWSGEKKKVAAVPLNPQLTPATPEGVKETACFDVRLDCLGAPVSGYYCRPLHAAPKSLPAILLVHGAGVRSSQLANALSWSGRGALAMDINAHGLPNGRPDAFYKDVDQSVLLGYRTALNDSREGCYYLGMFRRLMQAMNFLCSQPEWDGKTLIVHGSSQGGFQAIVAAGLDDRVTFFAAGVPAGCDHTGMVASRVAGWPKFPLVDADGKVNEKALQASRYFDAVNFAVRTRARSAIFTVGFIDQTCPPTSVYAAYNALPLKEKSIFDDVPSGHHNSPEATKAMVDAVMARLKAAP